MNIENLTSYLKNEESFSEKSISEIMHALEKYPYFQIAHMLLLKGIQQVQPDNYNKQLKISGSFISDKSKLFQFINQEFPIIVETTPEAKTGEKLTKKFSSKRPIRTKDTTEGKIKSIEKTIPTKIEPEIKKEVKETIEIKKETKEVKPIKVVAKRETVRKKVDLPEEEIEKKADENSKHKHKEIIKDFFHSTEKEKADIKVAETKKEEPQKPITEELKKEETQKTIISKIKKEEAPKTTIIKEVKKEPLLVKKEESPIKKEIVQEKQIIKEIQKKETIVKEIPLKKEPQQKKPEIKKKLEVAAKNVIKEIDITEKTSAKTEEVITPEKKIEKVEEVEKTVTKTAKDLIAEKKDITPPPEKESSESDAMQDIFSKIRQIKKEMNIDSGTAPKTIDINKKDDLPKLKKSTTRKSPSGRVIKESFIGFDESPSLVEKEEEKKEITDKKEESFVKDESDQIKESGLTAKDLFKKHKLKKEKTSFLEQESQKEEIKKTSVSPISKLVDIVNDKTGTTTKVEKEEPVKEIKKETPVVEEKTTIEDAEKAIDEKVSSGELSAAEALLQKIAEKKRIMQQQKIEDEQKKEIEKQKELNAVNELLKPDSKKTEEEKPEPPIIEKEEKTTLEAKVEETTAKIEETIEQNLKTEDTEHKEEEPVKKSQNLIDSFIKKSDSLERIGSKEPKLTGDISIESTVESEGIMTETYADLLINQKNYEKAIEVYKKLILKFPEKKTYFAIQIKKVESLIK